MSATNNNTQLHDIEHVSGGRPREETIIIIIADPPLDEGYWDVLGEHIRLNTKKKATGGSDVVKITFARDIEKPP